MNVCIYPLKSFADVAVSQRPCQGVSNQEKYAGSSQHLKEISSNMNGAKGLERM